MNGFWSLLTRAGGGVVWTLLLTFTAAVWIGILAISMVLLGV
jgi:hypothetical protein